jgi:hypothetical protein
VASINAEAHNFVQNVYADMFDAGFGETELGKQLSSADNARFFKNFNQIEGEQEKLDYLKDTWGDNIMGRSKWDFEDCFWVNNGLENMD